MIFIFQIFFIKMDVMEFIPIVIGLIFTLLGFVIFIEGAKFALLPMGEQIGASFIEKKALFMILLFGFLLGVTLTIAEPDVRLLAYQIENIVIILLTQREIIYVTALGLGIFVIIAILRIILNIPIKYILIPGYLINLILALFSNEEFLTVAFDMGGVTTGPMTVPFLIAFGVGIASVLGGRDRLTSGFGVMAIGSVGPIMAVLVYGLIKGGV
ncbi:DUF1538 domain-containing protein [Methanobacterium veterum]|uniref:DUF1538 domain-containing protein n=2 Tax=Methanobacteriaceae TaxID=2159 RepID=A0A9E4ZRU7_9EURY|nr:MULTISPECIES: DUF1538 domain-containing protein [Methanobacterium]MCZ3364567.1 DUF1538 domain-containing protein [Methanobacterium veterum]MCZ3372321.1 DUF1538 domain-containing protein [Methanobacterium veterum]